MAMLPGEYRDKVTDMIVDKIENRASYYCLGAEFKKALDFFADFNAEKVTRVDKYLNETTFVKIRPMLTKKPEEAKFEAHDLYADIHYLAEGIEEIGFANRYDMNITGEEKEKDVVFLEGEGEYFTLKKGWFAIMLPQDAHQPAVLRNSEPRPIVKLIAKVMM